MSFPIPFFFLSYQSHLCSEIHLFYSKACIIKTSLSWTNPLPWLTRMTTQNEKRVVSQVWFVPFPPLDFMTKPLFLPGLTFLCGSFFFFSSSSLCPSQHSNNMKQKHTFTFSFILEHWWLLLWEHNFTDHFHRNCSIQVRKSLSVVVCNKQMSPYFWAQQHCMVPDLGLAMNISCEKFPSKLSAQPGCMEHRLRECCICYQEQITAAETSKASYEFTAGTTCAA